MYLQLIKTFDNLQVVNKYINSVRNLTGDMHFQL